jgi:hypothetical protein
VLWWCWGSLAARQAGCKKTRAKQRRRASGQTDVCAVQGAHHVCAPYARQQAASAHLGPSAWKSHRLRLPKTSCQRSMRGAWGAARTARRPAGPANLGLLVQPWGQHGWRWTWRHQGVGPTTLAPAAHKCVVALMRPAARGEASGQAGRGTGDHTHRSQPQALAPSTAGPTLWVRRSAGTRIPLPVNSAPFHATASSAGGDECLCVCGRGAPAHMSIA